MRNFAFKTLFCSKKQASGSPLGTILQSVNTLFISIGLSIYYQWKLGLVTSLTIPVVLVAIYYETKIVSGNDTIEKGAFEKATKVREKVSKILYPYLTPLL